ncbi:TonB-dependent receptor [Sphingobium sp. AN641]|uniref:TonB-dependent receptor n=1 Tax=Sphingobium sp. AN641 TaxID=3133443 RepID=UPI0030BD5E55
MLFSLMAGGAPGALLAQGAPPQAMDDEGEEIVVTGQAPRGSVVGNIKPEQQLSPADVRALGVNSISELLTELASQTNAAGGSPVVLLNGKRISSFSEIQDLPTEAIARTEILPEQVALSYGYAPTQKVVNIVLRQRFRAENVEARGGLTTQGGREDGRLNLGLLRIQGDSRFTLDLKYSAAAHLLESERDVVTAAPRRPFALGGNVVGGAQVDPALSALAGQPVTIASAPLGASAPSLADFVVGANSQRISDLGRYRTLSPETESFSANATLARAFGGVSASLNGRLELSENESLQGLSALTLGLPAASPFSPFGEDVTLYRYLDQAGALSQRTRGTTGHVGLTLNGQIARGWLWSFTGNGDLSDTRTLTDRGVSPIALQSAIDAGAASPFGAIAPDLLTDRLSDRARAKSRAVSGDLLVSGTLFDLPAGAATAAIRLSGSADGFDARSVRSGVVRTSSYSRQIGSGQVSVDLPITSRRDDVLGAVGDLGVNVNAEARRLSDFGTLSMLGYGLRWTPIPAIRLLVSASQDRAAPSGQQINDPQISTPNVSLFDYATGQSVFVTQLSGGNAGLRESVRDQLRISATVKPLEKANLTLTAAYLRSRTDNPIAAFPTPTPAIEAAFPQRFLRDADGTLLQVDARPLNFLSARNTQLRWGFDYSIPLKSRIQKLVEAWRAAGAKPEERPIELQNLFGNRRPGGEGAPPREGGEPGAGGESRQGQGDGARGGGGGGFRGGGFGGGRGGGGGGRLSLSAYHTWRFTDTLLVAPGVPALNLLDGDATGSSGGQPRHSVEARLGYSNNGIGARLGVDWESATHVDGALTGTAGGPSRLNFGSLATVDLRLFANLGQMPKLARDHPFLRGSRISLSIDNLFNQRRSVTDATGATPLRYQPGLIDPLGRTVTLTFRKLFF